MTRSIRGFTLIEIIVVLAIMGIATTMGVSIFHKAMDTWSSVRIDAELQNKAESIFDLMGQDLSEVASANVSGMTIKSAKNVPMAGIKKGALPSDNNELTIPVVTPTGIVEVTYRIANKQDGITALARVAGDSKRQPTEGEYVAEGISNIQFEYLTKGANGQWKSEWSDSALPAAVRVSLLLADPGRPYHRIARKAVFPIRVD